MCMCMVVGRVGWGRVEWGGLEGDTVDRSAFWEICEAHAKLDAETIVFSDPSTGFVVNVLPEVVKTDSIGHKNFTLICNRTSSD